MAPILGEAFAVHAVAEFVGETVEAGARVFDLSQKLGVGAEELQQFQAAAKLAGVEGETAAHSLGFLNKAVGEAKLGSKEAQEAFAKLGVHITDNAGQTRELGDILPDVSDALAKLPDQQTRAAYAMKLFGREGQALLPVLGQGSEHLREIYKEFNDLGGGMSGEFVRASKETQDNLDKLKWGFTAIRIRIVSAVLPAVNWLIEKTKAIIVPIKDWMDHTSVLRSGLLALSAVLSFKMVGSVIKVLRVLGILKATALDTVRAFLGFALPLVGIALLYLAFDDLFTLLSGGDSEIGAILEDFGGVEGKNKYVDDLYDSWYQFLELIGLAGPELDDTNSKFSIMENVIGVLASTIYVAFTTVKLLFDALVGTLNVLKEMARYSIFGGKDKTMKAIDKAGSTVANDAIDLFDPGNHPATVDAYHQATRDKRAENGPGQVEVGPLTYGAPTVPGAGAGGGSVTVEQLSVNVTAGKNPEETGKRVAQSAATELEKQNRDASQTLRRM